MSLNPILLEVFKNRFASIAEEMGMALMRTAYSPNIKERRDFSCALFDAQGDMVAQAAHIPVHLGSMPLSVKAAIEAVDLTPGDMAILNDPFKGGTHLPDVTLVAPVFASKGRMPCFYVANRAHHADIGGMSPGSMPLSTSIFQEGMIIPPLKIVKKGKIDSELMCLILNNVRTPLEREGDFAAQIMANITGVRRTQELLGKYGQDTAQMYAAGLNDYSEAMTRATIAAIPDGEYVFTDLMDDDGAGSTDIPLQVTLTIDGELARLDFHGTGSQVPGSINAVRAITVSAVLYVFRCLTEQNIPANAGCLRPISITTPRSSIVDATFPAAVAASNVETSQRIVDVILGALAQALPERIPAASQGTMNNVTIGGVDPYRHRPFAYYETLAGGMGASAGHPGQDACHSHMTNTLNTPVEALEYAYPLRVTEYSVRKGTGGRGQYCGGNGMVREIELLADAEVTVLSERRVRGPYGLKGGESGRAGSNSITSNGQREVCPGKFSKLLRTGTRLRLETPGGGGFGAADKNED